MPKPLDEISSPVPLRRLARVRLVLAFFEKERAPAQDQRAVIEGELQIVRAVGLPNGRDGLQIGEDRIAVWTSDLGVGTERHRRIKKAAVWKASRMHRRVKLIQGPCSDTRLAIRRDVGCVERPERRRHRQASGEEFAFGGSVAGDAVASPGQIFALCDQRGIWLRRFRVLAPRREANEHRRAGQPGD